MLTSIYLFTGITFRIFSLIFYAQYHSLISTQYENSDFIIKFFVIPKNKSALLAVVKDGAVLYFP